MSPSFTCDLGTIAAGGSATVTDRLHGAGRHDRRRRRTPPTVTSAVPDPDPGNNTATDTDDGHDRSPTSRSPRRRRHQRRRRDEHHLHDHRHQRRPQQRHGRRRRGSAAGRRDLRVSHGRRNLRRRRRTRSTTRPAPSPRAAPRASRSPWRVGRRRSPAAVDQHGHREPAGRHHRPEPRATTPATDTDTITSVGRPRRHQDRRQLDRTPPGTARHLHHHRHQRRPSHGPLARPDRQRPGRPSQPGLRLASAGSYDAGDRGHWSGLDLAARTVGHYHACPGTADPAATGNLVNTATVAPPAGTTDPDPGNNTRDRHRHADTRWPTSSSPRPTARRPTPRAATVTYTITVTNNGPSQRRRRHVSDVFPAGLTGVTWTSSTTGTASVTSAAPRARATPHRHGRHRGRRRQRRHLHGHRHGAAPRSPAT